MQHYDAHAQLLFWSFNLLFRDVAVAVVVFLNTLLTIEHNVDRGGKDRKLCTAGENATEAGAMNSVCNDTRVIVHD